MVVIYHWQYLRIRFIVEFILSIWASACIVHLYSMSVIVCISVYAKTVHSYVVQYNNLLNHISSIFFPHLCIAQWWYGMTQCVYMSRSLVKTSHLPTNLQPTACWILQQQSAWSGLSIHTLWVGLQAPGVAEAGSLVWGTPRLPYTVS
jgi:hypothetical protein